MDFSNDTTIIWGITLLIGLVVIGVVAFLLHQITSTAKKINDAASQIWTQGKLVANNTIQIPIFLSTTNRVASKILKAAGKVAHSTKLIKEHAEGCPGCPACMLS